MWISHWNYYSSVLSNVPVDILVDVLVVKGVEAVTLVIDGDTGDYISKEYSTKIHTSCCCS